MNTSVIWGVKAKPGGPYETSKNPFGRDNLGYVWASSGREAINKFAARENLDPVYLEV